MSVHDWRHSGEPEGRLPTELLARHVAGALDPALHRAISRHLARCGADRALAGALEALAGHWLAASEPLAPADGSAMLEAVLSRAPDRQKSSSQSAAGVRRF